MEEIWKDIKGYEGLYQISNWGRVKSLERIDKSNHLLKETIKKQQTNEKGYLKVDFYKDKKKKSYKVHRLVAMAFLPNPNNLPEVNHKDENKQNNFVYINEDGTVDLEKSNIEWCDHKYNINYGTARERMVEKCSKTVIQIDKNTNEIIREFPSTKEVQRQFGYDNGHISACCRGKYKTAYNYIWRYKESAA